MLLCGGIPGIVGAGRLSAGWVGIVDLRVRDRKLHWSSGRCSISAVSKQQTCAHMQDAGSDI